MEFWEKLIEFISLSDSNVRNVVLGTMLIGATSAIVGGFAVLRKRSLVGDAISHAVLPGICLAFILFDTRNPVILLIGAFIAGWFSIIIMDLIIDKSKIKSDAAIGTVLSVFFGFGMLLLTSIQHSGNAAQSGLDSFLFGKAATLMGSDLVTFLVVSVVLLILVVVFLHQFEIIAFDPDYAKAIGMPVRFYEILISSMTVLAVTIGIQAVGVVLMAALIITPTVAARYWSDKLIVVLILAGAIGAFANLTGAFVSYLQPSSPTGPWIIVTLSMLAFASLLFAPNRGYIFRQIRKRNFHRTMLKENVLKTLYKRREGGQNYDAPFMKNEILEEGTMRKNNLNLALDLLIKDGMLTKKSDAYKLTVAGVKNGQHVVRLHRLWELYLTNVLNTPINQVHENAEAIEHILTPELEEKLEQMLAAPNEDPHHKPIPKNPYKNDN